MSESERVIFRVTPDLKMFARRSVLEGWYVHHPPAVVSGRKIYYGKKSVAVIAAKEAAKRMWETYHRPSMLIIHDRNGEPMTEHKYGDTAPGGSRGS